MLTLYSHKAAPNGWKVAIILEALSVEYKTKFIDFASGEQKRPEFLKINPNGRIPALVDHDNDNFVLWESNAMINYILQRYDKEYKYHFKSGTKESALVDQWMTFQVSGQGPYYGQAAFFTSFHSEKIPPVIEKYQKEALHIISVLDGVLASRDYLVGNKPTVADVIFFPYNSALSYVFRGSELEVEIKNFKNFTKWHEAIDRHPAVAKCWSIREKVLSDTE